MLKRLFASGTLILVVVGFSCREKASVKKTVPNTITEASLTDTLTATTEDGRRILLKDNGTWEFLREEPVKEGFHDFRNTSWGMSKEQVKKAENSAFVSEEGNVLGYQGNVGGLNCFIIYIFAEGKLVRARYTFNESHVNNNDYITDYNKLKETLTDKYGKGSQDQQIWKNDLYRDDYQNWGMAVSAGHLAYVAQWRLPKTTITLFLTGDNFKINLILEYMSTELKGLEEKIQEKKSSEEF